MNNRIDRSFERIILHDASNRWRQSIMANEELFRTLRREIVWHARSDETLNESNVDSKILTNIRFYLMSTGNNELATHLPSEDSRIMSMDQIEEIMQSKIDADSSLRSSMRWIERTPSGIFEGIFRNRSTFLRAIL